LLEHIINRTTRTQITTGFIKGVAYLSDCSVFVIR